MRAECVPGGGKGLSVGLRYTREIGVGLRYTREIARTLVGLKYMLWTEEGLQGNHLQ